MAQPVNAFFQRNLISQTSEFSYISLNRYFGMRNLIANITQILLIRVIRGLTIIRTRRMARKFMRSQLRSYRKLAKIFSPSMLFIKRKFKKIQIPTSDIIRILDHRACQFRNSLVLVRCSKFKNKMKKMLTKPAQAFISMILRSLFNLKPSDITLSLKRGLRRRFKRWGFKKKLYKVDFKSIKKSKNLPKLRSWSSLRRSWSLKKFKRPIRYRRKRYLRAVVTLLFSSNNRFKSYFTTRLTSYSNSLFLLLLLNKRAFISRGY